MKHLKSIYLTLILLLCISCTDHIVYHSYHHFSKEGWSKNDTLSLNLEITDSIPGNFEIVFLVRNQCSYPYQDFSAMVCHNMPDSTQWKNYKLSFILADQNGRWSGSGWGGLYESHISLGKVLVTRPTQYTFKITHRMGDEHLLGINDIGILVKKEVN